MRTFNVKLFAIIVGCVVVLAGAVHALHVHRVKGHIRLFTTLADQAEQRGEPLAAADYLKRYLQLNRSDAKVLQRYGLLLVDNGRLRESVTPLLQALNQEPGRDEARRRLIDVLLQLGRYGEAQAQIERLLVPDRDLSTCDQAKLPEQARLRQQLGECAAGTHQWELARSLWEQAIELDPARIDAYALLATPAADQTEQIPADKAIEILDRMVQQNPEEFRSYLVRGAFFRNGLRQPAVQAVACARQSDDMAANSHEDQQEEDKRAAVLRYALRDAREAVRLTQQPAADDKDLATARFERSSALLFAAECAHELAHYSPALTGDEAYDDQARKFALEARELNPRAAAAYAVLADIEIRNHDAGERGDRSQRAREILQEGLRQVPTDQSLICTLANLELSEHNTASAEELIARLRKGDGMAPQVRYLEARLLMERKQWSDAAQHLERIRASLAEWPALQQEADLWLGTCYGKLGRADLQIQAYQNAGRHDPHWIPALLGQADALLAAGRLPEALKQYEAAALRPDAPPGVQLSYVRLLVVVSLKQPTTAETWQQIRQRIDTVRNNPAASREQQRDSDILTAEVLAAQGDLAAAETQLTAAIAADPDCVDFRTTLAGLLLGEKRWDEAERTLQEASERFGDHVALRLARARLLMARHATDADAGERLRAELRTLSQFPPNMPDRDAIALASGLFPMLLVLGDRERAEELQREISMRDPSNLQARLLQFDFALQTKKTDRMEQLLRELERIEGQGPLWRYGNAVRLTLLSETSAKQNRVDLLQQALRELAEAARARPRWERAAYLKGRICDQLQSPDQALQAYEEAFHLGLREPHAIVRLIKLYTEREDLSSAVSVLAQLKKEGAPLSSRLAAAAAELAMKLGSGPQAQDLAELALRLADDARRHSQNFEDHLVYGQILGLTGRSDEAERAFLAARGLAPSEQLPWLLLVQLYKQTNREEEAQRLVTEARDSFGEQDSPLAIAQAYQLLQDVPQAEQHYVQALAAAPDDARVLRTIADFYLRHGKPEQARPLLAHLTSGSAEGASTSDLLWSRRALARLLLGVGDQYEWDEARQLIEQNLPEGGAALEDRRLKAILLSLRPRHDLRLEAIELLEGVLEQSPAPSADDRLVLARLHLAEQAWHRRQSNNAADPDRSADAERHRAEAGRHFAQARELLQKVLAADADHAPAMCLYVHALLANDRTAEAQEWIPRLTPHVAGNLECLTTALDVFRACDGTDEAYSLLNGLAPAEVTPESASLVLTAADLLSAFGTSVQSRQPAAVQRFHERAEELYRLLAGLEPRYHLALAGHCGRIGRTEEALALIEDHAGDASPMELASACVQTLQNAAERNSLRERMDAALAGVIDDSADSIPLRLARADLRAWTGDAAGAEEMYRQVLELAPRHVMAANNLAFLLAWQNKDLDEALRWIETAIAAQGEQPELLDTRACVRLKLAKPDTAIEDLQRALQEATDVAFLYHLSQAHLARNDTQQAQATWKSAQLNGLDESALHPVERDYFRGFVTRIAARE